MNYSIYPFNGLQNMYQKYLLLEKIGEGANGEVYKAKRIQDDRIVVVKYLRYTDLKSRERFQNEIKIYLKLQTCPFIVKVLDFSLEYFRPYLVMEFCNYGNARSHLAWFVNNPRDGVALLIGVAEAVRQVHDLGTYHRDIKPDNLLLDGNAFGGRTLKLGDAGMSCFLSDPSSSFNATYSLQGTPSYIAPELFRGYEFSAAADVFSLGVTIHELLTGIRPYPGQKVTRGPSEMRNLIERMVDAEPDNRPTIHETIAGMKAAVHQISANQNIYELVGGVLKAGAVFGGVLIGISALDYLFEGE